MKRCPKCGGLKFDVTWHVAQDVVVDRYGDYLSTINECSEIDHEADDEDIWNCHECGYSDSGSAFEVNDEDIVGEEDDGYISGQVIVAVDDMIENNFEDFTDFLSRSLIGNDLLMDVSYKVVGATTDGKAILDVRGYVEKDA